MQDDSLRPTPWWEGLPRWLYLPTTYHLTRFAILRALGFVYFFAFVGLAHQVLPLVGSHGLEPARDFLAMLRDAHHRGLHMRGGGEVPHDFWTLPTIFWWDASDRTLQGLAWAGVFLSALVMCGLANMPMMLALWILYGSFVRVGQTWFSFGWEFQILETGLIAAFLCPPLDPRPFPPRPPPLAAVLLLRWLTFRIMIGAGLIKMRGDPCWSFGQLRCLDWHFQTQPVPNPLSPLFHAAPHWFHAIGVLFNHLCELALPWFVFGPRLARLIAGGCMVAFQLTLIASGNLAFLNWLTVIPVLACFDDDLWAWILPRRLAAAFERARPTFAPRPWLGHTIAAIAFAVVVGVLSERVVDNLFFARHQDMNASYDRFDAVGTYGAFGSVGDDRLELTFEGTRDDDPNTARWVPYELPCKPGDVLRRPCTLGPYHHRLDWLLWFAAMEHQPDESGTERGIPEADPWVVHLVWKLLHADPWARTLLADDPFGDEPPRWIRIELYRYEFAPLGDRAWWKRTLVGEWMPPVSVDDDWLLDFLDGHGWSTTYERAPLDLP